MLTTAVSLAATTAALTLSTAVPAHVAPPTSLNCRSTTSSIPGAWLSAQLCWGKYPDGNWYGQTTGRVYDTTRDGTYAMFRIHYRVSGGMYWETHTATIATTKGHDAPWSQRAEWDTHSKGGFGSIPKFKDFWVQVCKKGSGHRTCDKTWH